MRRLLLAITTSSAALVADGDEAGQLERVDAAGLSAWVQTWPPHGPPLGRAELLAHHALVSRLHDAADGALPARFPTWVDEMSLRAELERHQGAYREALQRVTGRMELALTALWTAERVADSPAGEAAAAAPGRRYLLERQRAFAGADRRRAVAAELADELERLAGPALVDSRRHICPSVAVALSASLLVARTAASEVSQTLARQRQDVRILVNGPWPPYTFAAVVREA